MKDMPLTRRRFLEGCAGACALTAVGGMGVAQAFADGGQIGVGARPQWEATYTICEGCPNACSFQAFVVDGGLQKTLGNQTDPNAAGNLCARGYGFTQSTFSDARVKNPLRRKDDGSFQTIPWDDALQEIGDRLDGIVSIYGPGSLAMVYGGELRNARTLSTLFMSAMGSGNVFVDDVTYDVVKSGALVQAIGADGFHADVDAADAVLLVDTSLADVTTPGLVAALQKAREAGKTIVAVDPRLGTLASFAGEWYATNPGTELALLLAVCQYLVANGLYDKQFVAGNVTGFDAWAQALAEYTPAWAEGVCGVEAFRIEQLAATLHDAAPKVAIEYGNGRIAGAAYANSPQTVRVACLLGALLGSWGQPGGMLLPYDFGSLPGADLLASDAKPSSVLEASTGVDGAESAVDAGAIFVMSPQKALGIRALVTAGADVAYDYSAIEGIRERLESFDLFVCISDEMTETAECADYVLPLASYLERSTIPEPVQGSFAAYSASSAVLPMEDGVNARPLGEILEGIASACGADAAFVQKMQEAADEQLVACGLDSNGVCANGVCAVVPGTVARMSAWGTPSGTIECVSSPQLDPGDAELPLWVEPLGSSNIGLVVSEDMNFGEGNEDAVVLEDGQPPTFKLITGQQSVPGMHGYNTEELMDISETYGLDGVWINSMAAEAIGVSQGDEIVVYNGRHACEAKAFVTNRIVPTAVFMPMSYGRTSERQKVAKGIGENAFLFSNPVVIPGSGALSMQEACVSVMSKREGA